MLNPSPRLPLRRFTSKIESENVNKTNEYRGYNVCGGYDERTFLTSIRGINGTQFIPANNIRVYLKMAKRDEGYNYNFIFADLEQ